MINIYSIRPKGFNIGNDVIYLGLTHFIRKAFKQNCNIISLPATGKYENQRKAGITSQTIFEINQFGHGVIIGGGNLYENGDLDVNPIALNALEKPLMIFSVSRGKIYNNQIKLVDRTDVMPDETLVFLNKKADISISRDRATYEYLKNLGIDSIEAGCPSLFINEIAQHLVPFLEADKTDALISIRNPVLMNIPVDKQYEMRELFLEIILLLREKGYKNIKFLCHDHRDIPFAASFKGIDYVYTEDVFTYLTYLRNTKLNLTYRLHSFLPCLSYDIPAIKISYDQRAISMIETLGMTEWNINLLFDDVIKEIENRIDNLGDLKLFKEKLENKWLMLRKRISDSCEYFSRKVIEKM